MGQVLVAYADADAEIGARVATALADTGLTVDKSVGAPSLKADKARFDKASALVLVWSRHAAAEAGLRREAIAAAAQGKLTVAQVDGARPPPSLRTRRVFTVTRTNPTRGARALAKSLAAAPAKALGPTRTPERKRRMNTTMDGGDVDTRNYGSTWKGTILIALIIAGIAYGAAVMAFGPAPQTAIMALLPK